MLSTLRTKIFFSHGLVLVFQVVYKKGRSKPNSSELIHKGEDRGLTTRFLTRDLQAITPSARLHGPLPQPLRSSKKPR